MRSRQGSGTRVAQRRPGLAQPYEPPPSPVPTETSSDPAVGLLTPAVDDAIEFTIGALPAAPVVARIIADTVRHDLDEILGQSGYDPFGLPALRVEVAAYLRRLGVPTDPDQVLITSGAQQALHLIGSQLGGPGASILVENPTYIGAVDAFRATGNRLVPVPLDRDGVRVEVMGLLAAGGPVRFAYVIPTFHNPTGVVMPEARRRELTSIAAEQGFLVVEDLTPDASLGDGVPAPLAAFDPGERVVTVGSLSKLAWGGLRIGWIRAPRAEFDRLVAGKIVADNSTSLLTQAVGARVLERIDEVTAGTRARDPRTAPTCWSPPWPSVSRTGPSRYPREACRCGSGCPEPTPSPSAVWPLRRASSSGPARSPRPTAGSATTSGSRSGRRRSGSSRVSSAWRSPGPRTAPRRARPVRACRSASEGPDRPPRPSGGKVVAMATTQNDERSAPEVKESTSMDERVRQTSRPARSSTSPRPAAGPVSRGGSRSSST